MKTDIIILSIIFLIILYSQQKDLAKCFKISEESYARSLKSQKDNFQLKAENRKLKQKLKYKRRIRKIRSWIRQ